MSSSWAIQTFDLTKFFPAEAGWRGVFSRRPTDRPAVDAVNLSVRQGELFGLLGPNGAGKTTLIKMLSTLIVPTSGSARVNGFDLSAETAIKASIGLATSDERSFYWRLSGRQNLEFFARLLGLEPATSRLRIDEVLEQVQLSDVAHTRFQTYSTGMRQRLTIARALLSRPRLLFLDEPTKGLDPTATRQLHRLVRDELVERQGITVFLTTHSLEEAQLLCQRLAIMKTGRIHACGSVDELRHTLGASERYQLWVRDLPPAAANRLADEIPGLRLEPHAQSSLPNDQAAQSGTPAFAQSAAAVQTETRVEFEASAGDGRLQQALDGLHAAGARLENIEHQLISLETIFDQLLAAEAPVVQSAPAESQQPKRPATQAASPAASRSLPDLRTLLAFLQRDWRLEVSYRFAFFLQFFGIFFSVAMFYFISEMLGSAATPYLQAYGGDYFSFVLIGIAFSGYFTVGLSSFANRLRTAQTTGTLEAMLATPTSLYTIIISSSIWDYLMVTFRVLVYLVIGAGLAGLNLSRSNPLAALVVLALTVVVFSSLGITAASFIMVLKRGDPISWALGAFSTLLGGVYYPIEVMPAWLQSVARLLPVTYALEAMRGALLQGASLSELVPEILALLVFGLLLLPASLWAFRYAVRRARTDGSLTHY